MPTRYNVRAKAMDGELTELKGVYAVEDNGNDRIAAYRTAGGNITCIVIATHKWIKLEVCS